MEGSYTKQRDLSKDISSGRIAKTFAPHPMIGVTHFMRNAYHNKIHRNIGTGSYTRALPK